jgi:ssDNA-binding replication factor A large subunit
MKNTSAIHKTYHTTREKKHQKINRKYRNKQQFDEDGEVIYSSDNAFKQPPDEDEQGNVLTMDELATNRMYKSNCTPEKQDTKPAAEQEEQDTPPSPERNPRRLQRQDDETEKMNKLFASLTANTHKKLREQA